MQATRVLLDSTNPDLVKATGVEFTFSNITTDVTFSAVSFNLLYTHEDCSPTQLSFLSHQRATREVILSAGSIQTPQLLELSGIGDAAFLKSKGISPAVDLPGVGENLIDHPAIVVVEKLKDGAKTLDAVGANPVLAGAALAEWALGKGSELSNHSSAKLRN